MALKVFWPDDVPIDSRDAPYGWKLADDWYVVVDTALSCPQPDSTLIPQEGLKKLTDLQRSTEAPTEYQYIIYKTPNVDRLRFYSLQPLGSQSDKRASDVHSEYSASQRLQDLYDHYRGPVKSQSAIDQQYDHLDRTIALINTAHYFRTATSRKEWSIAPASSLTVASEDILVDKLSERQAADIPALSEEELAPSRMVLLHWFDICKSRAFVYAQSSAVVRQLLHRAREMQYLHREWTAIRSKDITLEERSRRYNSFYNTVWLIANDLIIGWTISSLLREQTAGFSGTVNQVFQRLFMSNIIDGLRWLDDWPVGLKLNTPLSRLFCKTYIGMTDIWPTILARIPITTTFIISLLGYLSFLGASMFLSAFADMLALATLHVRLATRVSGVVYQAEMIALYSLWNLFRGKRWNTLRNRVDSYDYGIDQLFLGTLLFTIALFLLPTIVTYYLFFAMASQMQLALLYVQGGNDTALSFINSFPLFALMLRLKEPSRLPGGVSLQSKRRSKTPHLHLELINMPIGPGLIFGKFMTDWHQLSAGYSPHVLLKRLISGKL